MTSKVTTLRVDFNNDDDNDVIRALRKRASDPLGLYVTQPLRLEDGEGNACLGWVTKLDGKSVWAKAEYGTWIDAEPVRGPAADDLLVVFTNRSAFTATRDTLSTPELVPSS